MIAARRRVAAECTARGVQHASAEVGHLEDGAVELLLWNGFPVNSDIALAAPTVRGQLLQTPPAQSMR